MRSEPLDETRTPAMMPTGMPRFARAWRVTGLAESARAIEDIPIESDVYGPDLTYTDDSGFEANLYGQVNLTYQGFDDGQETTGGIVDNGNWNTRLGFTLTQSSDEIILRARFETGLGLRNSALVSQDYEPPWIKWERTWLRWFEVAADRATARYPSDKAVQPLMERRGLTTRSPLSLERQIHQTASAQSASVTAMAI